jgi:hypothetical protein
MKIVQKNSESVWNFRCGIMVELIQIQGMEELKKALLQLPVSIRKEPLQKMAYEGAKIVRDEARAKVPKAKIPYWVKIGPKGKRKARSFMAYDWLKKQIVMSKVTSGMASRQTDQKFVGLDASSYYIGLSRLAWWGALIEKGWIPTGPKGGSKLTYKVFRAQAKEKRMSKGLGHIPGRPFLRPAFDNNVSRIIETMKNVLSQWLEGYKR